MKSIEATISEATEYKWATTKEELLDAIRKEFVTRELFEEKINTLEERMNTLRAEMKAEILRLDRKFTIMFVVLFFTIIFLNQNALEFIFRVLGLIR